MADPYRLIHLGIGEQIGTLDAFLLVGLNLTAYTAIKATTVKRDVTGLDLDARLQDGTIKRDVTGLDLDGRGIATAIKRDVTGLKRENG